MPKLGRAARDKLSLVEAIGRAVALHQRGQLTEAERLYAAILHARPAQFDALRLLGVLRYQQGRFADALRLIAAALRANAASAAALCDQGFVLAALARRDEALASFDLALAIDPQDLDVLNNRGNVLQALGRHEDACASYARVLAISPGHVDALGNRGNALRALGRHDDALASYDQALGRMPGHVDALYGRGGLLLERGAFAEALASFGPLLALKPDHVPALSGRAAALHGLGRSAEAAQSAAKALALAPDHVAALNAYGNALQALGRHEEALVACDRALAHEPANADLLNHRGRLLIELQRVAEAAESLDRALAVAPAHFDALHNRGIVSFALGRARDALELHQRVVAARPDDPDAQFNKAMVELCLGDFVSGWRGYEWRWRTRHLQASRRDFSAPLWLGEEPLGGKTILLHAEQGVGDTIQFVRYAPLLARQGANVVLELQRPLLPLFADMEGVAAVLARGDALPPFDLHCPFLSLPLACGTEIAAIPSLPRLAAPADRVSRWRRRLAGEGPRIGLAWAGRATHKNDHNRSIALERLTPILSRPATRLVSLQRELRREDAAILARHPGILQLGDEIQDFADTAAVISLLDLVVSVDTSVAHLAGALGRPVWILLPFAPDFRWMLEREDSPWYPSARLFRQPAPGDWDSIVRRLVDELDRLESRIASF